MFEVNTISGSRVTAKIAGTESMAKITSEISITPRHSMNVPAFGQTLRTIRTANEVSGSSFFAREKHLDAGDDEHVRSRSAPIDSGEAPRRER